jgi:hypothetical protein
LGVIINIKFYTMRNLMIFGLLVMFLIAAQFVSGQTVDDIINRYVDSIGGKDKLASIKSIYLEGSREMMGNEVTIRVTKEQGKLSRTEFEMGATNGFVLITTKEAWRYIPMRAPSPVKLSDEETASLQTELNIFPLVDYAANGNKAELLGKDTLNGTEECYKIKLTTATGKTINYWIDSKSYLLVQSSQLSNGFGGKKNNMDNNAAPKTPTEIFTLYKDYGMVDGIQIAHTIEIKGGMGGGSTTFDKVELNSTVDPKLYNPQ